jgi:hypothetical protein
MATLEDHERMEYSALMSRARDAERISQQTWVASGIAATVLLAWGVADKSPATMLPVVLAVAFGFHAMLQARNEAGLIAGYSREYHETRETGPQWFTELGRLRTLPGFAPASDWVACALANIAAALAVAYAWIFSSAAARGELLAGLVTGCGIAFAYYSISETARSRRTDHAAFWSQARGGIREVKRPAHLAAR